MRKLVCIGGGGHCKSVLDAALRMDIFDKIVITDPNMAGTDVLGCDVVGGDDKLKALHDDGYEYAFVTVGHICNWSLRVKLVKKALRIGFKFPTIVDPTAVISPDGQICEGTFIGKRVVINAGTRIGEQCIINTGAIVEHDSAVGSFSHIAVGTILCGGVEVGSNSFIGAGSTVIQGVHIGSKVTIGANSLVLCEVKDNMRCYGVVTNHMGGVRVGNVRYVCSCGSFHVKSCNRRYVA